MKCWYKSTLDISNVFKSDFKLPDVKNATSEVSDNSQYIWDFFGDEIFSDEWMSYIDSLNFKLWKAMVFFKPKNFINNWAHIDTIGIHGPEDPVFLALNWVIDGDNSEMIWYEAPQTKKVSWTKSNRPYIAWPTNTLTEIDRCSIKQDPVLINTSKPHAIVNKNIDRWCISVRFRVDEVSWEEIIESWFKKDLIIYR